MSGASQLKVSTHPLKKHLRKNTESSTEKKWRCACCSSVPPRSKGSQKVPQPFFARRDNAISVPVPSKKGTWHLFVAENSKYQMHFDLFASAVLFSAQPSPKKDMEPLKEALLFCYEKSRTPADLQVAFRIADCVRNHPSPSCLVRHDPVLVVVRILRSARQYVPLWEIEYKRADPFSIPHRCGSSAKGNN